MSRERVVDSHGHYWILDGSSVGGSHSRATLGTAVPASHLPADHARAFSRVTDVVHVEALPSDPVVELAWLATLSPPPTACVARVALERGGLPDLAGRSVCGVRQILNFDAVAPHRTWPGVSCPVVVVVSKRSLVLGGAGLDRGRCLADWLRGAERQRAVV